MKTFKQFIEAPKKPKGPSKTPTSDKLKIKHSSQRDSYTVSAKLDKERQSAEFKQMVTQQKSEMDRAKKTDKATNLRKVAADKRKKQQAKGK